MSTNWQPLRRFGLSFSMRRSTGVVLIGILGLSALGGGYIAYWRIVSGRIADGLVAWQQSARKDKIEASWQRLRVTGFPFAFRVEIDNAAFRNRTWSPAPEIRFLHLRGTARPWNFANWRFAAPQGFTAALAPADGKPEIKLAAKAANGTVTLGEDGAASLWLRARAVGGNAEGPLAAQSADMWVSLPAKPVAKNTDPTVGVALALHQVGVPEPPVSFGKIIDEFALGMTVKGVLPPGPLSQAAAAWRDTGGTIVVDNLHLAWSGLGISASGTLALDRKLQPQAAFSGGIQGFATVIEALVAADQMSPEQGALIQIALTTLSKPGPGGKPEITAPFTINNGKVYLGPARIGALPHIVWQ